MREPARSKVWFRRFDPGRSSIERSVHTRSGFEGRALWLRRLRDGLAQRDVALEQAAELGAPASPHHDRGGESERERGEQRHRDRGERAARDRRGE